MRYVWGMRKNRRKVICLVPSSRLDGKPGTEHRLLRNKLRTLCGATALKLSLQSKKGS